MNRTPKATKGAVGIRGPGRPAKYGVTEKPQRIGVYLSADLVGWLFDEVARRKRAKRGASISEVVSEAVAVLRNRSTGGTGDAGQLRDT